MYDFQDELPAGRSKRQKGKRGALSAALTYFITLSPDVSVVRLNCFDRLYDEMNNDQQTEKKKQRFRIHLLPWVLCVDVVLFDVGSDSLKYSATEMSYIPPTVRCY